MLHSQDTLSRCYKDSRGSNHPKGVVYFIRLVPLMFKSIVGCNMDILGEGDVGENFYFIESGSVSLSRS